MLVFPKQGWLLITPPRTGSKAVKQYFCADHPCGAFELVAPALGGRVSSHSALIPDDYLVMRKAVLVRHPLARLVSIWQQWSRWNAYRGDGADPFDKYVAKLAAGELLVCPLHQTISELTEGLQLDAVVHLERLETDLRRLFLPAVSPIPVIDRTVSGDWQAYFTKATRATAEAWSERDFFNFGYVQNGLAPEAAAPQRGVPTSGYLGHRDVLLEHLPKQGRGAEIGVFRGDFSQEILRVCKPTELHLIDMWGEHDVTHLGAHRLTGLEAYRQVQDRFRDEIAAGQVHLHRAHSLNALGALPDRSLDWVYVDASHYYYDVFAELCLCDRKIKEDGWICGHDYCPVFDFGVIRAVNLFCEQFGYELVHLTQEAPAPATHRFGVNAAVPPKVAYDSFMIRRRPTAS